MKKLFSGLIKVALFQLVSFVLLITNVLGQQLSDNALMDSVQRQTFRYFWDFAEPHSGLARERYHPNGHYPQNDSHVVTTGGSGFGFMAILIGIERGYITRKQGYERLEKMTSFLEKADRFHGAWSHWINGNTGKVVPFGRKDNGGDLVETAFMVEGMLCVRQYFKNGNTLERKLSQRINALWKGIEWNWYTQGKDALYWHWSPTFNWEMNFALEGYNEVLVTYILGASSPQFPIQSSVYHRCWARNGGIVANNQKYGLPLILKHNGAVEYGGPLFWAHYSFVGLDPRKLKDTYADYWQLNVNHTKINYQYCLENPFKYKGYGQDCWGLTASYTRKKDGTTGYAAHRPFSEDTGVISPTAALSSIPYTPKESLSAMRFFYQNKTWLWGDAGFYDAFSIHYNNWAIFWCKQADTAIQNRTAAYQAESVTLGALSNQIRTLEAQQQELNVRGAQLRQAVTDRSWWVRMLNTLNQQFDNDLLWLTVIEPLKDDKPLTTSLWASDNERSSKAEPTKPNTAPVYALRLQGLYRRNNEGEQKVVYDFAAKLAKLEDFGITDFETNRDKYVKVDSGVDEDLYAYKFEIKMPLRTPLQFK